MRFTASLLIQFTGDLLQLQSFYWRIFYWKLLETLSSLSLVWELHSYVAVGKPRRPLGNARWELTKIAKFIHSILYGDSKEWKKSWKQNDNVSPVKFIWNSPWTSRRASSNTVLRYRKLLFLTINYLERVMYREDPGWVCGVSDDSQCFSMSFQWIFNESSMSFRWFKSSIAAPWNFLAACLRRQAAKRVLSAKVSYDLRIIMADALWKSKNSRTSNDTLGAVWTRSRAMRVHTVSAPMNKRNGKPLRNTQFVQKKKNK